MKFAIVDIETTGGNARENKITEIAIAVIENNVIIEKFESLVNPHQKIPYFIQNLTGINNKMVESAPSFYQIAKQIVEILEGTVFVAHNVKFDYNFIKREFEELGYTFNKKKLCTVKLMRQYFPGIRSYGLDNLIKHYNIQYKNRHRAMGDVLVTIELFKKIYNSEGFKTNIEAHLYDGITSKSLPKNIPIDLINNLPEVCGNYFFHDEKGDVIYASTAKNIKRNVLKHLRKPNINFRLMFDEIYDISYEKTGNEIIGQILLEPTFLENAPLLNRNSNVYNFFFIIIEKATINGYLYYDFERVHKNKLYDILYFKKVSTKKAAVTLIDLITIKYDLCRTLNGLEESTPCFNYHMNKCNGACVNKESAFEYNERFEASKRDLEDLYQEDIFIQDNGRHRNESCIFYIKDSQIQGYYWLDINEQFDKNTFEMMMTNVNLSEQLNHRIMGQIIGQRTKYLKI